MRIPWLLPSSCMQHFLPALAGSFIPAKLTACLTCISSGQTEPQPDQDISIGRSGNTTFLLEAVRYPLTQRHGKCEGVKEDSRLIPVQRRGGLAETHVCTPLLPGARSTLSLGLFYRHHSHHLYPCQFSVHTKGLYGAR